MAHPLDGALAHVDRADRDFNELKIIIAAFIKAHESDPLAYHALTRLVHGANSLGFGTIRSHVLPAVPLEAAVLVGAIVHHLRAALEYLVYEIAMKDSGVAQDGTQFIIEDFKADSKHRDRGFDGRAKSKLKGLSSVHISAIERLQPYNGVNWTATLRDISNHDKHRKLTAVRGTRNTIQEIRLVPAGSKSRPGAVILRGRGASMKDIHLETDSAIYIVFPERNNLPVLETLEVLKREVRAAIDSFKPEFE